MAKWMDKQRLAKAGLRESSCIVCGESVMGCSADDNCPATLLCMFHYHVQALAYGELQSFGIDDFMGPIREGLEDWPRWKPMFEAAMKRRGMVHG